MQMHLSSYHNLWAWTIFWYWTFMGGCSNWNNYLKHILDKCTYHNVLKLNIEFSLIYVCIISTYTRLFVPLCWRWFDLRYSDQICKNTFFDFLILIHSCHIKIHRVQSWLSWCLICAMTIIKLHEHGLSSAYI